MQVTINNPKLAIGKMFTTTSTVHKIKYRNVNANTQGIKILHFSLESPRHLDNVSATTLLVITEYSPCLKKCAKLFLSQVREMSTKFDNLWHTDSTEDRFT